MKKILTLIAAAGLASGITAGAFELRETVRGAYLATPEMERALIDFAENGADDLNADSKGQRRVMRRDYSDGTYNYRVLLATTMQPLTDWWELYDKDDTNHSHRLEFEDLPMYVATYIVEKYNIDGRIMDKATCLVSWPTYAAWDLKTGKDNLEIVPIDVIGSRSDCCSTFTYIDDSNMTYSIDNNTRTITSYSIWSNVSTHAAQMCNGQDGKFAEPSSIRSTTFVINDFDREEETINTSNMFYFVYGNNNSNSGSMSVSYDGPGVFQGFYKRDYVYDVSEVHIFNAGLFDAEKLSGRDNPYTLPFEPKQKFWIYGATTENHVAMDPEAKEFDRSKIWFAWNEDISADKRVNDNYRSFYGPVYAPANTEEPNGIYFFQEVKETEYKLSNGSTITVLDVIPRDWTAVPRGYDEIREPWTTKDGFKCIWNGLIQNICFPSRIGVGTTDGFIMKGSDEYGNTIFANYKGDIVYHYDPSDMTKIRTISAVGTLDGVDTVSADSSFAVNAGAGFVEVTCEQTTAVAVYSLTGALKASRKCQAGASVRISLDGGVYVVRTNGGAKKVVVK